MTLETVETDIPASFATSDIVANFYHLLAFVPYKPYITPDALLLQAQNWYRFQFCQNHTNWVVTFWYCYTRRCLNYYFHIHPEFLFRYFLLADHYFANNACEQ